MKKNLPKVPGVYLFKNNAGEVLYIGKAKNIHKRVASYFNKQKTDWKVYALLKEHAEIDYILTKNETEALLLEAQLIHDHKPKFNVLLKEGQPFVYLVFTKPSEGQLSRFELVRNKKKKGSYFGPFLYKQQARSVHRYLTETFRLNLCNKKMEHGCLDFHLGLCAGNCTKEFDREGYLFRLELAKDILKKNHKKIIVSIEKQIELYNKSLDFEKAMHLHGYLQNLDLIFHTIETKFSKKKYQYEVEKKIAPSGSSDVEPEQLAAQLQVFVGSDKLIRIIDCFDVSHFQSNALVGSCVRFVDGKPDKSSFRKFKIKTLVTQNDYAALQEIVIRRYKNNTTQELPDLVLIDGGKGQLHAVQDIIPEMLCIALAKREETLFGSQFPDGIKLDVKDSVGKILIALRDYAHHFAISYHRSRRNSFIGH